MPLLNTQPATAAARRAGATSVLPTLWIIPITRPALQQKLRRKGIDSPKLNVIGRDRHRSRADSLPEKRHKFLCACATEALLCCVLSAGRIAHLAPAEVTGVQVCEVGCSLCARSPKASVLFWWLRVGSNHLECASALYHRRLRSGVRRICLRSRALGKPRWRNAAACSDSNGLGKEGAHTSNRTRLR